MHLMLRQATMADSDMLLAWRNDETTRAFSKSTKVVPEADHRSWMKLNVEAGYPTHIVMIAETDVGPAGVVRFDTDKGDVMTYWVSITVAPKVRGRGFGQNMLEQACHYANDYTLKAEIRGNNKASITIFERCGFQEIDYDVKCDVATYKREPQ